MTQQETHELKIAIENLYEVFYSYTLKDKMNYCDCGCISKKDINDIYSKPLKRLTTEDLAKYSHKAMTTWGDSYDFRHFFPRLTELLLQSDYQLANTEIIFSKLTYGEWHTWERQEQETINNYFIAIWNFILSRSIDEGHTISDEYLCAISQAIQDPTPMLEIWQNRVDFSALKHFYYFIDFNHQEILSRKLANAFWETRQEQMQIVLNWLLSPDLINNLENRVKVSTNEEKKMLLKLVDKLKNRNQ